MTIRVLAVGNLNTDQSDHRSLITSLTQSSTSVAHRPGFFPTNLVAGLTNVSAMTVGVGNFKAIVANPGGAGQYLVQSDAVENIVFADGEASVSRTDRIIVRVYNHAQDGSGKDEAAVEYLKGQVTGAPTPVPAGSLLIWEIPVPAGSSSGTGGINFSSIAIDKRVYTTASGGIIPVANTTELNAISNPWEGMAAYTKDSDLLYIHDGSVWRVRGQAAVSSAGSLSGIQNPYSGLLVVARDTGFIYEYNGSAWVAMARDVLFVKKPESTLKSATTTLGIDPHLVLPVKANAEYVVEGMMIVNGNQDADIKFALSTPTGSSVEYWTGQSLAIGATSTAYDMEAQAFADQPGGTTSALNFGSITLAISSIKLSGYVKVGATPGNVGISWAQRASVSFSTSVSKGSWLELRRKV